jgi:alkaline phosphatase D
MPVAADGHEVVTWRSYVSCMWIWRCKTAWPSVVVPQPGGAPCAGASNQHPDRFTAAGGLSLMVGMLVCALLVLLPAALAAQPISRIAFGSCLKQDRPQPIWNAIVEARPDIFLFAGDNVYADTTDAAVMSAAYQKLGNQPGFQRLRALCPVHATWDDHDYGRNDAGADYPMRVQSKQIFMEFFELPPDAPMRARPGIYASYSYGPAGKRVQLILLDTRSFRSPLKAAALTASCPKVRYVRNDDPATTLLGEDQWSWLEQQLAQPAELRIIVSSIQVIPDQHCFEKWDNLPHERTRLFELIAKTGAQGVVLISGDRHFAEISRFEGHELDYPLYEVTASGLNAAGAGRGEKNRFRLSTENFRADNFGLILVDWSLSDPLVRLQIRDAAGNTAAEHRLNLSELQPGR